MSLSDIEPVKFWLPPAPTETDVLRFAMAERERARYRVTLELIDAGVVSGFGDAQRAAEIALRGDHR